MTRPGLVCAVGESSRSLAPLLGASKSSGSTTFFGLFSSFSKFFSSLHRDSLLCSLIASTTEQGRPYILVRPSELSLEQALRAKARGQSTRHNSKIPNNSPFQMPTYSTEVSRGTVLHYRLYMPPYGFSTCLQAGFPFPREGNG